VIEVLEDRFPILLHLIRDLCRQIIDAHVGLAVDPTDGFPRCDSPPLPTRELDLVERIFYMRQMMPFRESSVNALFELSRSLTEVRFGPGVTLWETGDVAAGMFLIVSGQVAGTVRSNGLRFCAGTGIPLGSLEAVAEAPRWYDAVTQTEVVALNGNAEALVDVFEDNFEMAMDFLAVVARWMLRLVEARAAPESPPEPGL